MCVSVIVFAYLLSRSQRTIGKHSTNALALYRNLKLLTKPRSAAQVYLYPNMESIIK